ncbi:MAG TPA: methylmalonyl-CoA mutase family protein, partial [Longimicrobiales bacterium]
KVDELGGASRAIEYFQEEIHRSSYQHQLDVEAGRRAIVGINVLREDEDRVVIERPDYSALEVRQREMLARFKGGRDPQAVQAALKQVREAATQQSANLLPVLVDAVKQNVTLGEISDVLRAEWGVFKGSA